MSSSEPYRQNQTVHFFVLALSIKGYVPRDYVTECVDTWGRWYRQTPDAVHASPECHTFFLSSKLTLHELAFEVYKAFEGYDMSYTLLEVDPLGVRGNTVMRDHIQKEVFTDFLKI